MIAQQWEWIWSAARCNTVPLSGAEDVKRREDKGEFDHAEL